MLFRTYLEWKSLIDPYPGGLVKLREYFLFSSLAVLILGLIVKFTIKTKSPLTLLARRIGRFLITYGFLLSLWFFFRDEEIPYLGSRFWILIYLFTGVVWLASIFYYAFFILPKENQKIKEQQERNKYLKK